MPLRKMPFLYQSTSSVIYFVILGYAKLLFLNNVGFRNCWRDGGGGGGNREKVQNYVTKQSRRN